MLKNVNSSIRILLLAAIISSGFAAEPVQAKPHAVNYSLKGILAVREGTPCLYTSDGRVFQLQMDLKDARELDGKAVGVEGKVGKSDDVETVKVKKIETVSEEEAVIEEVEHEAYQRPAKMLADAKGTMTVSNIRWEIVQDPTSKEKKALHTWEDVTIDLNKVTGAYFVVKPFAPKFLAAHTLLTFTFAPGGAVSKSGAETKTITLTIEAYKKIGQSYGLIKTMKKEFDIVWVLTTLKNYADLNVNYNKSSDTELTVYPIAFNQDQARALLSETVKQACVNRQGEYYNTIRNNCTNNLIILLNRVLPENKRIKLWTIPGMIYNLKATMPLSVVKMLKKKGLIGEPLTTINRDNFAEGLNSVK